MIVVCEYCTKPFNKPPFYCKRTVRNFCTKYCWDMMQVIDAFLTGRRIIKDCAVCGDDFSVPVCMARRFSTCSETCYRRHKSAEQNPNWRGGVTAERKAAMSRIEYKDWRRAVFERDNYTCADCGKRGGDLEADHIKPWAYCPELRYTVSNGRTLCATCHHGRMWEVFTHRPGKDG